VRASLTEKEKRKGWLQFQEGKQKCRKKRIGRVLRRVGKKKRVETRAADYGGGFKYFASKGRKSSGVGGRCKGGKEKKRCMIGFYKKKGGDLRIFCIPLGGRGRSMYSFRKGKNLRPAFLGGGKGVRFTSLEHGGDHNARKEGRIGKGGGVLKFGKVHR